MAISGLWQAANSFESGAAKWGTGFNPVHRDATMGPPLRSSPVITGMGPGEPGNTLPVNVIDPQAFPDSNFEYLDEDFADTANWGYGVQTGTSDRPGEGTPTQDFRGNVPNKWPSALTAFMNVTTGGQVIRAENHGATNMTAAKLGDKEETVGEGWVNKEVDGVNNAKPSAVEQYERQTSMQQRDQVRAGSQRNGGSASEYNAPIGSERPTWGVRIKPWSGGRRHYDMFPYQADEITRPFLNRQAGTGRVEWLGPNEAFNYQVLPLQRQPVADPYSGAPSPAPGNVYQEESSNVNSWVDVWY
jgi:hypothetical protein